MTNILEDEWQLEDEFARDNDTTRATTRRYRKQPNGLPFAMFNGKVYIHVPSARDWLRKRMQQRNLVRP